jgi:hypothetical protein
MVSESPEGILEGGKNKVENVVRHFSYFPLPVL